MRLSVSLGVLVDLETVYDCPNPANEQPAGQDLDNTKHDSVYRALSHYKVTSGNSRPARKEDG